jgi:hypothetical protein
MRGHPGSAGVQVWALRCLRNLAFSLPNKGPLMDHVPLLVRTLEAHGPGSASLCEYSCRVLQNLASGEDNKVRGRA